MGVDVMLTGPLPTPGIAFITQSMRADAGVVISASHNPYQDNGIKFFARDGFKLPDETELRIERLVLDGGPATGPTTSTPCAPPPPASARPSGWTTPSAATWSSSSRSSPRTSRWTASPWWSTAATAPPTRWRRRCFEELGAKVMALNVEPDGKNINDRCGAVHPEGMAKAILRHKAHLGMALDGDADRVIMVDEQGRIVDGDAIMALVGRALLGAGAARPRRRWWPR